MSSLVSCYSWTGRRVHASSVGSFKGRKEIFYPWWNGVLHFCIYKDLLYLFSSISHHSWSTDYGKKQCHTLEFCLADCTLMSHLNTEPMFTSSYEETVLCCWALWKTELSEMLKCEGEEICLWGKCIRQHFKICLFDSAADFAYLFLSSGFIISIVILFYTGI